MRWRCGYLGDGRLKMLNKRICAINDASPNGLQELRNIKRDWKLNRRSRSRSSGKSRFGNAQILINRLGGRGGYNRYSNNSAFLATFRCSCISGARKTMKNESRC